MDNPVSESLEKLRQQFDNAPYPTIPLDNSPKGNYNYLFIHNLVTSHYLQYHSVIKTEGKQILDAGCGTGYKSLVLAEANPGAHIVGIDLSEESVKLARQRLDYHGFKNVEFHVALIEELPTLGMAFDYINCDEVLYLLPVPQAGLQAMKSVLKPQGLLRLNLHSFYQRSAFYRAQKLFQMMGLMDDNPQDTEIDIVIETMKSLKDEIRLKAESWKSRYETPEGRAEILSNHLLIGDKGSTIPELFALLEAADLEFVSMVNWRHWDATDLFQDPDNLPAIWAMSLEGATIAEQLHLYELIHPIHRLLDCWCTHSNQPPSALPVSAWTDEHWKTAIVHLHPQLRRDQVRQDLIDCVAQAKPFEISAYINLPALAPVLLQSALAATLLPLWAGPQSFTSLVERRLQVEARHPVTLEPITPDFVFTEVKHLLDQLHTFLYVLPEQPG